MKPMPFIQSAVLLACALSLSGCWSVAVLGEAVKSSDSDGGLTDGSTGDSSTDDAGTSALACTTNQLDLLIMMDDSGSMRPEQQLLSTNLPKLVKMLTTGDILLNDVEGDASTHADNVRAFTSLHVAFVTSDMGTAGYAIPGCDHQPYGDDGVMRNEGDITAVGCTATYPRFLEFTTGGATTEAFAQEAVCIGHVGTTGCGFEQQLDSVLKALTPSTSPIRFFNNTTGHGDESATNNGFLRQDSVLAVLMITDEEDSSVQNPNIFNPSDQGVMDAMASGVALNIIGHFPPTDTYLYPVSRYIAGLKSLRSSTQPPVVFAAFTGVPTDLVSADGATNYDAILSDSRMQYSMSSTDNSKLTAACSVTFMEAGGAQDLRSADPERRLVEVAQGFGANGLVRSICEGDMSASFTALAKKIGGTACPL